MTFKFRKARSDRTLSDLESFLREVGDEPIEFLTRTFDDWRQISYDELEDLILSGRAQDFFDWQSRYAEFVNTKLSPLWLTAIQVAAHNSTRGKMTIDDSDPRVKDFLQRRGSELITQLSDESRKAVANVILHGQAERLAPKEIARQIRPLIGLNARQAQANVNYRQRVFNRLIDNGLSINAANQRADKAAVKYASKQHRQRAETIVHTELARAYNVGAHEGVLSAVQAKLMNHCEMVWTTSGTNRVCGRCLELKDTVVGRTNEVGVTLPPLHPRCRCTISYREIPLTAPSIGGNVGGGNKPLTLEQIKAIRDAEDKAFHAATGADFGFTRMKISPDWSKEVSYANGDGKGIGRMMNCQRCVVAHEARMRGYDVVARLSWGNGDDMRRVDSLLKVFADEGKEIYRCKGNTVTELEKFITEKMTCWGTNSRAFVWFEWDKTKTFLDDGHVIVAQLNENGFVNFGDPQMRKIGAVRCLGAAKFDSVKIMRIDNLRFTDWVKRCCVNER